jgi:hypothetical protein
MCAGAEGRPPSFGRSGSSGGTCSSGLCASPLLENVSTRKTAAQVGITEVSSAIICSSRCKSGMSGVSLTMRT